jgi:hypothetical protein
MQIHKSGHLNRLNAKQERHLQKRIYLQEDFENRANRIDHTPHNKKNKYKSWQITNAYICQGGETEEIDRQIAH